MKFTIIIPVYNKADTIAAAVKSIYAQTIYDYEIIVVDDGSNDVPESALAELKSSRLRFIRQENGGVSAARNTGLSNAHGDYVCFLDADDLWKPEHLETISYLIDKYPEASVFVTSHEVITVEGNVIHSSDALGGYSLDFATDDLLGLLNQTAYSVLHTNSVCAKRSMMEQEGIHFEPGVKIGEDTDVWYRLGLKHTVAVSKTETTMYRREYSTATRESSHIQNWVFSLREQEILLDDKISEKVKASFIHLIDRYKMTCCREYMASKDRSKAKSVLSEVKNKYGKRYVLTRIFTVLPYCICGWILKRSRSCH